MVGLKAEVFFVWTFSFAVEIFFLQLIRRRTNFVTRDGKFFLQKKNPNSRSEIFYFEIDSRMPFTNRPESSVP